MQFAKHVKWRSEKFGGVIFETLNEKVYVTNETGNEVLRLIDEGLDASAVVERLQGGYVGDREQVRSDVAAFLEELQLAGLLSAAVEGEA
ncbi:MAG: PqqD family protein [Planctomycetota bacterium]|jgi:hypothetical protein